MMFLQKIWSIIAAIIPSWILTIPLFLFLNKKHEHFDKHAFVNMFLQESLFNKDDNKANIDGELPKGLQRERMPEHLAVILDGNRRWAKERGLASVEGYEAALGTLGVFLPLCRRFNIPILSLFLFSSENWLRPKVSFFIAFSFFSNSTN